MLARLEQAGRWALAHPADYAKVYAGLTRLPIETATDITGRAAIAQHAVTPADIAALQRVADRAQRDAILPTRVEVASIAVTGLG